MALSKCFCNYHDFTRRDDCNDDRKYMQTKWYVRSMLTIVVFVEYPKNMIILAVFVELIELFHV